MKLVVWLFLMLYAAERLVETFWKRPKLPGKIVSAYSLPCILTAYLAFYLTVLWDWHSMDDAEISIFGLIAGVTMVMISIIGRNWSIRALGPWHSIHIEIREQHVLVQSGPYRYIRNPYYLSNIIEAVGLPLIVKSGWAFMVVGLVYLPFLIHRLVAEEIALESKFKANFVRYRTRVPSLIPTLRNRILATEARESE